jgi:hypothetical protein
MYIIYVILHNGIESIKNTTTATTTTATALSIYKN